MFLWLTIPHHSPPLRKTKAGAQNWNLKARTEIETMGKVGFPWLAQLAFLYNSGPFSQPCQPPSNLSPHIILYQKNAQSLANSAI